MADGSHYVKNKKNKMLFDLKLPEMRLKVNFGQKIKKRKFCIDLKWPEITSKVNFGHPKWPTAAIW